MAASACVAVTGAAVLVGVMATSQAQPAPAASEQPVVLDTAAQPAEAEPPVEVPVEVQQVGGYEEPATLEDSSGASRYVPAQVDDVVAQSVEDIPAPATAAYQRAETVIGAARPRCHLEWTLLAAVGRVESDHGREDGGVLGRSGKVNPARVGERIDGRRGRQAVRDTDGGTLDGDRRWDRTLGPLNFLPTTWNVVGVDSDGDGRRDPQDLDDAALAAAVLLCGKGDDLATRAGLAKALQNLSRAGGYARAVVTTATAYTTELEEIAESAPTVVELPGAEATTPPDTRAARRNPGRRDAQDRGRQQDRGREVDLGLSSPPGRRVPGARQGTPVDATPVTPPSPVPPRPQPRPRPKPHPLDPCTPELEAEETPAEDVDAAEADAPAPVAPEVVTDPAAPAVEPELDPCAARDQD